MEAHVCESGRVPVEERRVLPHRTEDTGHSIISISISIVVVVAVVV